MDKTQTFAEIGIPFRLYDAPIETCSDFVGRGDCSICGRTDQYIFAVGIGDYLIVSCDNCGQINGLNCSDKKDGVCPNCSAIVAWPLSREQVLVCYDCLRKGRVHLTQDTELGMITWENAQSGWTHGIPGHSENNFPVRSHSEFDPMTQGNVTWYQYALPRDDMEELGRTPTFSSWQGERWLLHCERFMTYIGEPLARPQNQTSPEIIEAIKLILAKGGWEFSLEQAWNSSVCVYLFRCEICGALDGYDDVD